ncbi:gamma-glutamyl-gamma-aminobutyrate hydrolase family protein [Cyanobium sp. Cruz-8H5]|uniref:gamma-glutamyl-gamma-aminobutyrate hydrolase family protein n=1 Tax=Cyanobium sp. Cruz-8H5 TaxID=2823712 RepID=UPI0020CF8121|nr:gamma-glutamyl-gamma-aminobutyrate hydrolase family protein [Cyanobium sp. Cruz-8H5]MCP9861433.1 gamma-glutamyl-gamma-aminobutyrate hydrolase family protein [Cyanobium sp. Cruz-8H5]
MPKPVIGLTTDYLDGRPSYWMNFAYVDAVVAAGGLPLLLPFRLDTADVARLVDLLDGIIFTGGNDLDPASWGEGVHPKAVPVDPARERFERALMTEVERRRKPTLGICLGSQLMNVHRGGSMKQYIPDLGLEPRLEHRRLEGADGRHKVNLEGGSVLAEVFGSGDVEVNSAHKQAIGRIGRGLRVVATAPDGIIEGVEDPGMPLWLGVQWHPERIFSEGRQIRLFELLVRKAGGR